MKKTASYSHVRSKVLAVFMAALMACFSLTPVALADDVTLQEDADVPSAPTEESAAEDVVNGEIIDGKIHLTVTLPSKSFVYDGEEHSLFDEETNDSSSNSTGAVSSDERQESADHASDTSAARDDSSQEAQGVNDVQDDVPAVGEGEEGAVDQTTPQQSTEDTEASNVVGVEDEAVSTDENIDVSGTVPEASQATDAASGHNQSDSEVDQISTSGEDAVTDVSKDTSSVHEGSLYPVLAFVSPEEMCFTYDGETYTVTGLTIAEVVATEIGSVSYEATGTPQIINSEGVDVSDGFTLEILPGNLVIEQRSLVLVSDSLFKTYEPGTPLVDESGKVAVEGDGFLPGDGAQYTFTGSQEEIGSSLNSFTYEFDEGTDASVYKVVEKPGTLYVTAFDFDGVIPMTINAITETISYDGQPHYLIDYATSTFSLDGEENQFTVEASNEDAPVATELGEYSFVPEEPFVVTDSFGNDVSAWFAITWEPVTLTIEPRAMYLKVNDQTKLYGEEDPSFTYQFLATDSEHEYADTLADADDLGEIVLTREEGEDVGEYAIIAKYEENANYTVTVEDGTLSIAAAKIQVDVESVHVTYDGEPHSVTVNCDMPDVTVLYKTPDSEWGEENPAYTEIGTYPVYVQILPTENNTGNTASDVIEAEVVISSDDPAEDPDASKDDTLDDDASQATTDEPQGPASPAEDPDYADPDPSASSPTHEFDASELPVPDEVPSVDVDDLTLPDTLSSSEAPGATSVVPENELSADTASNTELLATTSNDDAVGANSSNKTQKSETVPMTVNEASSSPFGGIFGIIAIGIIVLALCGIGAAIYVWRTKETDE